MAKSAAQEKKSPQEKPAQENSAQETLEQENPTQEKPAQKNKNKNSVEKMLVRALDKRGFRRAGLQFDAEGVELLVSDLTPEQLEALCSEPRLAVEPLAE
jgi:hypothetical protein